MYGYPIVFLFLGWLCAAWVVVAFLPLRSTSLRIGLFTGHAIAALALIPLDGPEPLWAAVFVWIVVASLPPRSAWIRIALLAGHVLTSVAVIVALGEPREWAVMVFGPGLLTALVVIIAALARACRQAVAAHRARVSGAGL